jgi:hypothetical protein
VIAGGVCSYVQYIVYFILPEKYNKVNVVKYIKLTRDKISASYNLFAMLVGGQRRNEDNDVHPDLQGLKTYAGSTNNTASEKIRKSYDLMRLITS